MGEAKGLTSEQVEDLRRDYGFNEVIVPKRPWWKQLLSQFYNTTTVLLVVVIAVACVLKNWLEAGLVAFLLLLNAILSFQQDLRSARAVEALKERLQVMVRVLRDGQWSMVPSREVVPKDVVRLRAGDFVPAGALSVSFGCGWPCVLISLAVADVRVLQGEADIDQSALTGESTLRSAHEVGLLLQCRCLFRKRSLKHLLMCLSRAGSDGVRRVDREARRAHGRRARHRRRHLLWPDRQAGACRACALA